MKNRKRERGKLFSLLCCAVAISAITATRVFAVALGHFEGTTKVSLDAAPIRTFYPDGRIVAVVKKNTPLTVSGLTSDRRGSWVSVKCNAEGKDVRGYIDVRFTSFWKDYLSGKVSQPKR